MQVLKLLVGLVALTLHIVGVGSEGSLGIVTKVSILTPPKLSSVNAAFLACKDYSSIQA